eukprot:UN06755
MPTLSNPTFFPTSYPTTSPSCHPSSSPTTIPTTSPTTCPTEDPSKSPAHPPSEFPIRHTISVTQIFAPCEFEINDVEVILAELLNLENGQTSFESSSTCGNSEQTKTIVLT